MNGRSVILPVRFTPSEAAQVRQAAEIDKRSVSQWARARLLEILEEKLKPAADNAGQAKEATQ